VEILSMVKIISTEISNDILTRSNSILLAKTSKIYKESLRQLRNIFGNIHYIRGDGKAVKIKCITGNPERSIAKQKKDDNIILPLISITEVSTNTSDERNRYSPTLVHDKHWDDKQQRAIRILSLSPRPVNITYQINILSEYREDLDHIRSAIFLMFNPHMELQTSESDIAKVYIEAEEDDSSLTVMDQEDRVLKKSILIRLETYISSPKFLFTSSGKIETFHLEAELVGANEVISAQDTYSIQIQTIIDRLRYLQSLVGNERDDLINEIIQQIMALTYQF
jgi:hypothetical protein